MGEGKVYIPNIFTPDGNGINDIFIPFGNDEIAEYENFTIRGSFGSIIYEVLNVPADKAFEFAWSGKPDQEVIELSDGTIMVIAGNEPVLGGLFDYIVSIRTYAGESITVEGKICSFPCQEDDPKVSEPTHILNCAFPAQSDLDGGFDMTNSNFETWDCIN